ncbi:MAG: hypothetical protein ACFFCS_02640 [Candidatus Hodarchaeota archaeon]
MSEDLPWDEIKQMASKGKPIKVEAQHLLDVMDEIRAVEAERDKVNEDIKKMNEDFGIQSKKLEELGAELEKLKKEPSTDDKVRELTTKVTTLEADAEQKADIITRLEKDLTEAKNKLSSVEGQVDESKLKELEDKISSKDKEMDEKSKKIAELEEKLKNAAGASAGGASDLAREKEEFELEKKRLFKEMEDFEVGLRMEMDEKDNIIKELQDKLDSASTELKAAPTMSEERKQSLIEKLGLDGVKEQLYSDTGGVAVVAKSADRIVCPKCGGVKIKPEEDKNRVLTYMGGVPLYAKKYVCRDCQYEFRVD